MASSEVVLQNVSSTNTVHNLIHPVALLLPAFIIAMKQTCASTMRWKVMNILKTLVVLIHIIT